MATWGLILETTVGLGERKHTEAYVMAHVAGGREVALAELERRARAYAPEHPRNPKRRRLFRDGDGFLLVVDGTWQSHATRFYVGELIDDTDRAVPAEPVTERAMATEALPAFTPPHASEPPPPSPPEAVERDEDGIPVKPGVAGTHRPAVSAVGHGSRGRTALFRRLHSGRLGRIHAIVPA